MNAQPLHQAYQADTWKKPIDEENDGGSEKAEAGTLSKANRPSVVKKRQLSVCTSVVKVALFAITILGLLLLHKRGWTAADTRHTFKTLFEANQVFRVMVVSFIVISSLFTLYCVGKKISNDHYSKRLKMDFLPEKAAPKEAAQSQLIDFELLEKVVGHNASWRGNGASLTEDEKLVLATDEMAKAIVEMMVSDEQAETIVVLEQLAKLFPQNFKGVITPDELAFLKAQGEKALSDRAVFEIPLSVSYVSVKHKVILGLGSIWSAIGIGDLFEPTNGNDVKKSMQGQKMLMFINFLAIVSPLLMLSVGPVKTAIILSIWSGGITALGFFWYYISPIPTLLPGNGISLSDMARRGEVKGLDLRKKECAQAVNILNSGMNVTILAKSRMGKTEMSKLLALKMANGEFPGYEKAEVYMFNGHNLANSKGSTFIGGTNDIFRQIMDAVGVNKDNFIMIVDEGHGMKRLLEQAKSHIDKGGIRMIFITTEDEFDEQISDNAAFINRFAEPIRLHSVDEAKTLSVLQRVLRENRKSAPIIPIEVLQHIYAKTTNPDDPDSTPQPYRAEQLLNLCIAKASVLNRTTELQGNIADAKDKLDALLEQNLSRENAQSRAELEATLEKAKEKLIDVNNLLVKIARAKQLLYEMKDQLDEIKIKMSKLSKDANPTALVQEYRVLEHVEIAIGEHIRELSLEAEVTSHIDKAYVDRVLAEDLQQKAEQQRKRVEKQLQKKAGESADHQPFNLEGGDGGGVDHEAMSTPRVKKREEPQKKPLDERSIES